MSLTDDANAVGDLVEEGYPPLPNSLQLRTTLLFIGIATVGIGGFAGLAAVSASGITLDLPRPSSTIWHQFVAVAGVLLPVAIRIVQRNHSPVRKVFNAYLLGMVAQILTEIALLNVVARGIIVVIGTLYSGFRLVQLWQGQQWLRAVCAAAWLQGFLWVLIGIWGLNLGRFLFLRWPLILQG